MNRAAGFQIAALAAVGLVALFLTAIADAKRAPIKDCGDISMNISAITAQGTTCTSARAIARALPGSKTCTSKKFCQVRSYTCLLGPAGKELTLVHCENSTQTRFVRFEFGA
jgi:hypothetical protein